MERASGVELEELKADGGAVVNGWLMKFQADVLGVPVVVPEVSETTALGAAYLAGVATGTWSEEDARAMWREGARRETTALGAAYLGGVAPGTWSGEDVRAMWRQAARYEPSMSEETREELLAGWA